MTHDLDHHDLDDLLRSTLQGRADTVTSGPRWDGAPVRRSRGPWLGIAAAAVTVLALAGGLAALSSSSDDSTDPAAEAATVCRTTLPAEWKTALAGEPLVLDGRPVTVSSVLAGGRLIGSFFDSAKAEHSVLIDEGRAVRELATVPSDRIMTRIDQDGTYAVISTAPKIPVDSPDSSVDEVEVVNLSTGTTRDVLAAAPVPAGWGVSPGNSAGAVVQNGVVYVGVRSGDGSGDRGEIITYTIRTGRYAVAARTSADDAVLEHDVRGVTWQSGSVPASSRPEGLPPFFDKESILQPIVSDGRAAAWTERDKPSVVHWTDGAGGTRSFDVEQADPVAVSGRFVVLQADGTGNSLLDVETGAVAPTADESEQVTSGPGALIFNSPGRGAVRVATASLPDLRC